MQPQKHAVLAFAVGGIGWWRTGQPAALVAALAAGLLPDVDHIADYSYWHWRGEHRLILPLHGYELALIGAVAAWRKGDKILGVAALSYLLHLLADQLENHTHALGYSLLFRFWHRFRIEQISTMPESAIRGRMADIDSLKGLLQRYLG
jgi:hypothetical protein